MLGYGRIPAEFKAEFPSLENKKFDFTEYSFNEIVKSTEARALKAIAQAGGKITPAEDAVKLQKPKSPSLEQRNPGQRAVVGLWSEPRRPYTAHRRTPTGRHTPLEPAIHHSTSCHLPKTMNPDEPEKIQRTCGCGLTRSSGQYKSRSFPHWESPAQETRWFEDGINTFLGKQRTARQGAS
jgi:hypothetical protein